MWGRLSTCGRLSTGLVGSVRLVDSVEKAIES
jgi:hypothetical protein